MTEAEAIQILAEKVEAGFAALQAGLADLTGAVNQLALAVSGLSSELTTIASVFMVLGITAFVIWKREMLFYVVGFALNFFVGIQWLDINMTIGGCLMGLGVILLSKAVILVVPGEVSY